MAPDGITMKMMRANKVKDGTPCSKERCYGKTELHDPALAWLHCYDTPRLNSFDCFHSRVVFAATCPPSPSGVLPVRHNSQLSSMQNQALEKRWSAIVQHLYVADLLSTQHQVFDLELAPVIRAHLAFVFETLAPVDYWP